MAQYSNCCDSEVAYTVVELADSLSIYSQNEAPKLIEPPVVQKHNQDNDPVPIVSTCEEIVINDTVTSDVDILTSLSPYNSNSVTAVPPPADSLLNSAVGSPSADQILAVESQQDVFSPRPDNPDDNKEVWSLNRNNESLNESSVNESESLEFETRLRSAEHEFSKCDSSWQLQLSPSQRQKTSPGPDSVPLVVPPSPQGTDIHEHATTAKDRNIQSSLSSTMCTDTNISTCSDRLQTESHCQTDISECEEFETVLETIQRTLKKRYILSKDHNGCLLKRNLTNVIVQEETIHSKIVDVNDFRSEPRTYSLADNVVVNTSCTEQSPAGNSKCTDDGLIDESFLPDATPMDSLSDSEIKPETSTAEEGIPDELEKKYLRLGSKVYAKWSDSCFYSGSVCKISGNKYEVLFDDNFKYTVKEQDIIPHSAITSEASIMVQGGDGCYEPAIIKEIIAKPPEYTVETDDGKTLRISKSCIMLTLDQVSALFPRLDSPFSTKSKSSVSLDNVIGGKRRRKLRSVENSPNSLPAKRGKFVRNQIRADDSNDHTSNKKSLSNSPAVQNLSPAKAKRNKGIFSDLLFVVTMSSRTDETLPSLSCSVDSGSRDTKCELLDKRNIKQLIVSHGGQMCEDVFSEMCNRRKTYLISNTESRTLKYLVCVACGIPCISYRWILDCINKNKLLDWTIYRLPNGISIETGEVVQWVSNFQPVFKNQKTIIVSPNEDFVSTCKSMLLSSGCEILQCASTVSDIKEEYLPTIDFIISDNAKNSVNVTEERHCKVPVMTLEWIIQSVICGSRRDPKSHTSYNWQTES